MFGGQLLAFTLEQRGLVMTIAHPVNIAAYRPHLAKPFPEGSIFSIVQLVMTSQIFLLNCYQENVCLMNFFVLLLG